MCNTEMAILCSNIFGVRFFVLEKIKDLRASLVFRDSILKRIEHLYLEIKHGNIYRNINIKSWKTKISYIHRFPDCLENNEKDNEKTILQDYWKIKREQKLNHMS